METLTIRQPFIKHTCLWLPIFPLEHEVWAYSRHNERFLYATTKRRKDAMKIALGIKHRYTDKGLGVKPLCKRLDRELSVGRLIAHVQATLVRLQLYTAAAEFDFRVQYAYTDKDVYQLAIEYVEFTN